MAFAVPVRVSSVPCHCQTEPLDRPAVSLTLGFNCYVGDLVKQSDVDHATDADRTCYVANYDSRTEVVLGI